jgi:hypothetical protein
LYRVECEVYAGGSQTLLGIRQEKARFYFIMKPNPLDAIRERIRRMTDAQLLDYGRAGEEEE